MARTAVNCISRYSQTQTYPMLFLFTIITNKEHGEELFGMYEALEIIWRNQNPPDCSKAKYLFGEGWTQGFGSELHGYGVGLAVAIDMGRVFVQTGSWTWRYKNKHCESQNKHSLECYFLPFSNCTIKDALLVLHKEVCSILNIFIMH